MVRLQLLGALGLTGEDGRDVRGLLAQPKRFALLCHVDQVMRDALAGGGRRFGRAQFQAAIDLHGIDRNDLAAAPLGQAERDFGFTNGGWAGQQ